MEPLIPLILGVLTALGLLGGIGIGINAVIQRRSLGANATAVVTAAARELVDPLRKELATERADHAKEIELERGRVRELHNEVEALRLDLSAAREETRALRKELSDAWSEISKYQRRIQELEERHGDSDV